MATRCRRRRPIQVLEMRLVCGDILRQDLSQLLAGMHQHAAEHAAAAAQWAGDGHAQDVQQGPSISGGGTEAAGGTGGGGGTGRVKVVANLPYYITKDCLLQVARSGGGGRGEERAEACGRFPGQAAAAIPTQRPPCRVAPQMLPRGGEISDLYFMLQVGGWDAGQDVCRVV